MYTPLQCPTCGGDADPVDVVWTPLGLADLVACRSGRCDDGVVLADYAAAAVDVRPPTDLGAALSPGAPAPAATQTDDAARPDVAAA